MLVATVLGSSMAFIDGSVVNVALPAMEADLRATLAEMAWVSNAYTLCMSALLLIGGAAGDQLGRRRIFLIGLLVFAGASIGCGLADNVGTLVVTRAIQGVGAALLIPSSLSIIGATFDPDERGAAIGIWSGASAMAAGGGPLLGGWLVDHWSWRAIFLINPVLALPTIAIVLGHLSETRDASAQRGLDWPGAALAFGGLGLLAYGLLAASAQGWSAPTVLICIGTGALLLVSLILRERTAPAPMMPLTIFRSPTFSAVNILTFFLYGALSGCFFFVPFLLIQVHGYSATATGAAFLPFTLILALLSRRSGRLGDRVGSRLPLMIGPPVVSLGLLLLSFAGPDGPYWRTFLLPMLVLGFGMAIVVAPLTTTVLNSVPGHHTGVASGVNNAVTQVAGLLLIAVLSTVGITTLDRSLDRQIRETQTSPEVRQLIEASRGAFVIPDMRAVTNRDARQQARSLITDSLLTSLRRIIMIGAALALLSALPAVVGVQSRQ